MRATFTAVPGTRDTRGTERSSVGLGRLLLRARLLLVALLSVIVLLCCLIVVPPAGAAEPLVAYAARIAGDGVRTRIVIDLDRKPDIAVHYLGGPPRIIVDLPATAFAFKEGDLEARGLFRDIRFGAMGPSRSRLVLRAKGPVRLAAADVIADEGAKDGVGGYRLVLDAEAVTEDDFATLLKSQDWSGITGATPRGDRIAPTGQAAAGSAARPFTVVIDAGHGGIDSGAIGVDGAQEKEVTLAFAKTLAGDLSGKPGVRVVLTRDDDTFIALGDRVRIARQHGADLFISLHADSISTHAIRGATVYTLSDKASDRMAAEVAARENESDAIAGISLENEPADVADILIDLTRRETQAFSIGLARSVVSTFEGEVNLINNPHRHAGFRVLQAPDVPSVLLELGYLSNPDDEALLTDEKWRRNVCALIARSIEAYRSTVLASSR